MPRAQKAEKTALMYATDLLAQQEQSEQRLREKLMRKGYGEEEIDGALEHLKSRRYLDDASACARQFRFLYEESRSSLRQICAKLQQRGFDSSLVRACIPEDTFDREREAALKCLRIKYRRPADGQKMMQYLYQRGFAGNACRAAAEEFADSEAAEIISNDSFV